MSKPGLAQPKSRWVQIDTYLGGLASRRSWRRSRRLETRSEPEAPRMMLSTVPFAALMALLGLLIVAFAIAAWPGSQPDFQPRPAVHETGTAAPGWFDEAKKDMR